MPTAGSFHIVNGRAAFDALLETGWPPVSAVCRQNTQIQGRMLSCFNVQQLRRLREKKKRLPRCCIASLALVCAVDRHIWPPLQGDAAKVGELLLNLHLTSDRSHAPLLLGGTDLHPDGKHIEKELQVSWVNIAVQHQHQNATLTLYGWKRERVKRWNLYRE